MKLKNVYISCPITIPQTYLSQIYNKLDDFGDLISPYYWDRNEIYDGQFVQDCDAIVIVHQTNSFNYDMEYLPAGVNKELKRAIILGKKIFGAYKTATGETNFYDVQINGRRVSLVSGSTTSLNNFLNSNNKKEESITLTDNFKKLSDISENKLKEIIKNNNNIIDEEFLLLLR